MRNAFNLGCGRWLREGARLMAIGMCLGKGGSIHSPWMHWIHEV